MSLVFLTMLCTYGSAETRVSANGALDNATLGPVAAAMRTSFALVYLSSVLGMSSSDTAFFERSI